METLYPVGTASRLADLHIYQTEATEAKGGTVLVDAIPFEHRLPYKPGLGTHTVG